MNLPFVVAGRFGIPRDDDTAVNTAFGDLSPDKALGEKISQISNKKWFNNYVRSLFLATAKETLSHYETMEIGMIQKIYPLDRDGRPDKSQEPELVGVTRADLNADLKSKIDTALKNTPAECLFAAYVNFDYPEVITDAIEKAKEREIQIKEEKAEQQKRLIKKKNEEALAQYNYRIEILDALKVADSNKIIGESVSLGFLWYLQTKVFGEAAQGPNNWGIVPYTAFESQAANGMINTKLMDEMLKKRLTESGLRDISDVGKKLMENRPKVKIDDVPPSSLSPKKR